MKNTPFLRQMAGVGLALFLSSCMTNGKTTKLTGKFGNTNGFGGVTSATAPFSIPQGAITVMGGDIPQFKIDLITGIQGVVLGNFCTAGGTGTSACRCVFRWSDSGTPRGGFTYLNTISTNTLFCNVPTAFTSTFEMPNGTSIAVDVTGDGGRVLASGTFVKGTISRAGGRADQNGSTLFNVSHYSCYEKFQRPTKLLSAVGEATDQQGNAVKIPYANNFCYRTMSGQGGAGDTACQGQDLSDEYSVQSFYYNLYTNNSGAIHSENQRYTCPKIKNYEPDPGAIPPGTIRMSPVNGASAKHWPLDSTFALADNYSANYPVGVTAQSLLGSNQTTLDADLTKSEACLGQTVSAVGDGMQEKSILNKCIGYAAKPLPSGACPVLQIKKDNCVPSGTDTCLVKTPTFRLRRYYALYPPTFDTNGSVFKQPSAVDVTFVLDRCVNPLADGTCGSAMSGPKPCPFAWYDKHSVVNASTKKYYGTNHAKQLGSKFESWSGTNPDGTKFPNLDGENSCSALLPVIERGAQYFSDDRIFFATTHVSNPAVVNTSGQPISLANVYIRPMQAWAPHYVEDTDFQACAPASFNPIDPPLYLTQNTANRDLIGWCTVAYPTNGWDDVSAPSPAASERIPNGTSGFLYRKIEISNPTGYNDPPLLAPLEDIDALLQTNASYACQITQETRADGSVGPPLSAKSPSIGGCCRSTGLVPGLTPAPGSRQPVFYLPGGTAAPCLPTSHIP